MSHLWYEEQLVTFNCTVLASHQASTRSRVKYTIAKTYATFTLNNNGARCKPTSKATLTPPVDRTTKPPSTSKRTCINSKPT
jgi:nitric oxide synthase oxygenase domain/subunit